MVDTNRRRFLGMTGSAVAGAAVLGATVNTAHDVRHGGDAIDTSTVDPAAASFSVPAIDGPARPTVTELRPFSDPLRIPPTLRPRDKALTVVRQVEARIRLHSQLPPTRMWTYDGIYPGPTIDVRSEERIRIAWHNSLQGTTPVKAVYVAPQGPAPGLLSVNTPGSSGATERTEIAAITPLTTVHLHGGHHHAINDGAPDSGVTPGSAQLAEYANDEAAAHLFYHDHAMPITSINVMSGLMGNYIVRDASEDRLNLPRGEYEIPLMISDVNFDTDSSGRIDGQLLSKRLNLQRSPQASPLLANFLGPYTMVNGVVWPYLEVKAAAYRFRMVNISVSRAYALVVVDEDTGAPVNGVMKVLGTDMGLLREPKTVDGPLKISPAERVDLLIDFSAFPGKRLRLVNTFPGVPAGTPVPLAAIPHPEVMQFRVARGAHNPYAVPAILSSDFRQITPADLPKDTEERFTLLVFNAMGMPTMLELQESGAKDAASQGIEIALPDGIRTFRAVGSRFEDTTTYFAASGDWVKWTIINVAPPGVAIAHPIHIHLLNFQILQRNAIDGSGFNPALGQTSAPITLNQAIPIAPEESGWKDTVVVPSNTAVSIAGQFGRQTGRFMYHCHILDHEDEGMMRPHVLMPPAVLAVQMMMMSGG